MLPLVVYQHINIQYSFLSEKRNITMMDTKPPGDPSCWKTPAEIWTSNGADAVAPSQRPDVQIKLMREPEETAFRTCEQSPLCSTSTCQEAHGGLREASGKSLRRQVFPRGNCKPASPGQQNRTAFPHLPWGGRPKQT